MNLLRTMLVAVFMLVAATSARAGKMAKSKEPLVVVPDKANIVFLRPGKYGDMLEEGILDPAKVTRLALQNAASDPGLLLTTEVMIAEAPKEESIHTAVRRVEWAAWAGWTCKEPRGF